MLRDPRRLVIIGAVLFLGILLAAAWHTRRSRDSDPLTKPLRTAIVTHLTAVPSADSQITAAWREAEAARARGDSAVARARVLEKTAAASRRRADSLDLVARASQTVRDSADAWRAAYDARTEEADTLRAATASANQSLEAAHQESSRLRLALVIADSSRHRADSLLNAIVTTVSPSGTHCSIPGTFGLVGCPSRTATFVGGALLATIGAVAISHGRLPTIPH